MFCCLYLNIKNRMLVVSFPPSYFGVILFYMTSSTLYITIIPNTGSRDASDMSMVLSRLVRFGDVLIPGPISSFITSRVIRKITASMPVV